MRYFRFGIVVAAVSALAVFSSVPSASATANHGTRFVAPTGTDTGRCIAAAHPCLTINYAVSQAGAGDTIRVAAGNYPEIVTVDKPLTFLGANVGRRAGVTMQHRAPESVVQGFRSPGSPYPTAAYSFKVTIDGFTIDPQGDATLIAGGPNPDIPYHFVSLFGGPMVSVRNNIFNGGPFVSDCSYTCTTMSDFALLIQSGKFEVKNNTFTDFRRPVDISQNDAAHRIVAGSISGNLFEHITSRGIWLREGDCYGANACGGNAVDTIAGIEVTGNTFDGTGALSPVTGGPAGLVMTTAGNLVMREHVHRRRSRRVRPGVRPGQPPDVGAQCVHEEHVLREHRWDHVLRRGSESVPRGRERHDRQEQLQRRLGVRRALVPAGHRAELARRALQLVGLAAGSGRSGCRQCERPGARDTVEHQAVRPLSRELTAGRGPHVSHCGNGRSAYSCNARTIGFRRTSSADRAGPGVSAPGLGVGSVGSDGR